MLQYPLFDILHLGDEFFLSIPEFHDLYRLSFKSLKTLLQGNTFYLFTLLCFNVSFNSVPSMDNFLALAFDNLFNVNASMHSFFTALSPIV